MDKKIAVVTGASRGIGRGVAVALNDAGYRVLATGRGIAGADLPPQIERLVCDHRDDAQTAQVFAHTGAPDVLVNCACGGYELMSEDSKFTWGGPGGGRPRRRGGGGGGG